jgi:hypothetical protein
MPRFLSFTLAVGVMAASLVAAPSTAEARSPSPRIVARPDSVMVLMTTRLTGTHFTAGKRITIEECSEKNWIAPQDPCDTTSSVKVKTDATGRFTAVLTAHPCPGSATPGFDQTCYVGEPDPTGIDTIGLVGAKAITVTGP